MEELKQVVGTINGIIWHDSVLYLVLGVGILFTVWSGFGQYRALTHGIAAVRGKFDHKGDPGAISHFQALSTALSATVGLGNIAGVAIAISLGGPGALFWMWVVGLVGMALKMTEVTQSMLFRDTSDPDNPHGGPMWVCKRGLAKLNPKLAPIGTVIGAIFCLTLLVSTTTGGNMFQAWNVADISYTYFGLPQWIAGIILTIGVGLVIIGGIKRIGDVASRVVPFMCGLYVLAGLAIIVMNIADVPSAFVLIFSEAFSPSDAGGAFVGGAAGYAFLKGMQRALFSNEAGQGSAPIAHSAARTDEPVREGVVAGLEPFIDTLLVCTLTGLVILLSGAWNRDPALSFNSDVNLAPVVANGATVLTEDGIEQWQVRPVRVEIADEVAARGQMREGATLFVVVEGDPNAETGGVRQKVIGELVGSEAVGWTAEFEFFAVQPGTTPSVPINGAYFEFKGATLTAKAFDREIDGIGTWIIPLAAWLFAFSTIISWSYYGEQGIVYLFGQRMVMPYRVVYCALIMVSVQLIETEAELDMFSTLGTGVMLLANIPIMLIFGPMAMRAYKDYIRRLDAGEMSPQQENGS